MGLWLLAQLRGLRRLRLRLRGRLEVMLVQFLLTQNFRSEWDGKLTKGLLSTSRQHAACSCGLDGELISWLALACLVLDCAICLCCYCGCDAGLGADLNGELVFENAGEFLDRVGGTETYGEG